MDADELTVIVTGSRDFEDRALVWFALDILHSCHPKMTVRHGDHWEGADQFASKWAQSHGNGVDEDPYPANWTALGRKAGPVRNRAMVIAGADLVLAFFAPPPAGNIGTQGCVDFAHEAGIQVIEYGRR